MSTLAPLEALNKVVDNEVANLRLVGARTLANLYNAGRVREYRKTTIDWDVDAGGGQVAIEPVTQNGQNTLTDTIIPAQLRIGRYRVKHQFPVSRVAIQEAKQVAPAALQDLFGGHVRRGLTHILRESNRLFFAGDGTAVNGEVVGISKVLDPAYNYAGINVTAFTNWKAVTLTNATARALTRDLLLDFDEAVMMNETSYNMIVCHPTTAKAYTKLFDNIAGGGGLPTTEEPNSTKRVDLGHGGRYYSATPIVEDPMCPVGQFIAMDLADINVYGFSLANDPMPMSQYETRIVSNPSFGMPIHISELPSMNSAVRVFEMYCLPQVQVFNRKSVQGILNLTV